MTYGFFFHRCLIRRIDIVLFQFSSFSHLTRVVNTGLDDIIQGVSAGCLLVPQLAIDLLGQHFGHMVVVLGQVRELLLKLVVEFEVVVGVSERHDCFLTLQRKGHKNECT